MQAERSLTPSDNQHVADCLLELAQLLEAQGANPFRVNAYRAAANTVGGLEANIRDIFERDGIDALDALPRIGAGIARAIAEMLATGRWGQLERLRGSMDAAALFQTVPGLGAELAARIHDTLHIDTLEELELAASDGRLLSVKGLGPRRAASIRAVLADILSRTRRQTPRQQDAQHPEPSVAILLDIDREYREKAAAGALPTIAPKRMNPGGKAWLPVLHATRSGWHFTALFSNTPRAHELGRSSDWVVIYFYNDAHDEHQRTVVTETRGTLVGKRVVRGREAESRRYYST